MNAQTTNLPIPPFYQPRHAEEWGYRPDQQALFEAANVWRAQHNIPFAGNDTARMHLLIIDAQKDFCFPEGSLYVAGRDGRGAIADNQRIAEWIYRNLGAITEITTTLDTHFAFQIFFPSFFVDQDGSPLTPHRVIATDDVVSGRVQPNPAIASWLCKGDLVWLRRQIEFYCQELERQGLYSLYLWPPHCLLGSDGHALAGVIHEARLFHSFVRGAQSLVEIKGTHPLTENYSVLAPEVLLRFDGHPLAQKNTKFIQHLTAADTIVICGQAASHCVRSSIRHLLNEIRAQDPDLVKKVYILTDCMSAVVVRDPGGAILADFTGEAEQSLQEFADAGMHLVRSTDEVSDWLRRG